MNTLSKFTGHYTHTHTHTHTERESGQTCKSGHNVIPYKKVKKYIEQNFSIFCLVLEKIEKLKICCIRMLLWLKQLFKKKNLF